jgi:hypothetical protein
MLLMCQCVLAYECNVSAGSFHFETETETMCNYINYHILVMFFFGYMCISSIPATVCFTVWHKCYGIHEENRRFYTKCTLVTFILAFGVETVLALIFILILAEQIRKCCSTPRSRVYAQTEPLPTPQVPELTEVIVVSIISEEVAEPTPQQPECTQLQVDAREECSICLDSSGDPDAWFTTTCKHSFHLACINDWVKDTCPLCRKCMFFGGDLPNSSS